MNKNTVSSPHKRRSHSYSHNSYWNLKLSLSPQHNEQILFPYYCNAKQNQYRSYFDLGGELEKGNDTNT